MKIAREYSEKHIHFFSESEIPKMLERLIKSFNNEFAIIDLGCGDGKILYALYKKGLLGKAKKIVGVDISEERIERLKVFCPFAEGIVSDIQDLKTIPTGSFDIAICSQVIEHVPDDKKAVREAWRILRSGGYLYISSVIKKPYGVWVYWDRKQGFKLDPTHLREYRSEKEFLDLLKNNGFKVERWGVQHMKYPLLDLMLRALIRTGLFTPASDFYLKHKRLKLLREKLRLRIIGYAMIEAIGKAEK